MTDNPVVFGTSGTPIVRMEANAVAAGVGIAMDTLAIAIAEVAALAERRLDRMVNPLVSGLPAFLVAEEGVRSGLMIAQYTASALVSENRRLAAPASPDNGISSALQEDHLAHATPASLKALSIVENFAYILSIELVCATQAAEFFDRNELASATHALFRRVRSLVESYDDDRPLALDLERIKTLLLEEYPDRQRDDRRVARVSASASGVFAN